MEIAPGIRAYLTLTYEASLAALRDPALSNDPGYWQGLTDGLVPEWIAARIEPGPVAARSDGAEHQRLRRPLVSGIEGITEKGMFGETTRIVDSVIDELIAKCRREGEVDLIADFAALVPVLLLSSLFGFSAEKGPEMAELAVQIRDGDPMVGAHAKGQLYTRFIGLITDKRRTPGQDLTSRILDGAERYRWSDDELISGLMQLIGAGHEPTTHLIGNTLYTMLTCTESAAAARTAPAGVEEVLQHVCWTDPPSTAWPIRYATTDTRFAPRGVPVVIGFAAAHSDPEVHHGNGSCDPGRHAAHLIWGVGPHKCPARSVAWAAAVVSVEALLRRVDGLRLVDGGHGLQRQPGFLVNGWVSLPATFRAPESRRPPEPEPAATRAAVSHPSADTGAEEEAAGGSGLVARLLRRLNRAGDK